MIETTSAVLKIDHLVTQFRTENGYFTAVNGLTLNIEKGEFSDSWENLVQASPSPRSRLCAFCQKAAARIAEGTMTFLGKDLVRLPSRQMQELRGHDISMIFQEPGTSLKPVV